MQTPRVVLAAVVLCVTFVLFDFIATLVLPLRHAELTNVLGWNIAANAVIAFTIVLLSRRARWRGLRLGLALAAIPSAVAFVNIIEGVVYLSSELGNPVWLLISALAKYLLVLPLASFALPRVAEDHEPAAATPALTLWGKLWRFAISDLLYLILYFSAGILIFPLVRDFYEARSMPPVGRIFGLQLFVRGPVFIVVCIVLSRMIRAQRMAGALIVGVAFALVSGVAPLIVPSPFFPDAIRWVHLGEVASSNFLFGVLVALIWSKKPSCATPMTAVQLSQV
jgi:hypothetical protein